jgi:kynurenine formamidase
MSFDEQLTWIRGLARRQQFGQFDRLGSVNYIDSGARLRAAQSVRTGQAISIARTIDVHAASGVTLEVSLTDRSGRSPLRIAVDKAGFECHGLTYTHLDGLNHVSYDDTWYSGWPVMDPDGPSILDLATVGIFTRAVHVDISVYRGQEWASADVPVSGNELQSALDKMGVEFQPGDALLLDMGRDRFEAAGHNIQSQWRAERDAMQPGLGTDGAQWIADHGVSVLCWDFQDAIHPDERKFSSHQLIWSVGQVIVDNCDFSVLRSASVNGGVAGLVIAPIAIPRATGCNINPIVLI